MRDFSFKQKSCRGHSAQKARRGGAVCCVCPTLRLRCITHCSLASPSRDLDAQPGSHALNLPDPVPTGPHLVRRSCCCAGSGPHRY